MNQLYMELLAFCGVVAFRQIVLQAMGAGLWRDLVLLGGGGGLSVIFVLVGLYLFVTVQSPCRLSRLR